MNKIDAEYDLIVLKVERELNKAKTIENLYEVWKRNGSEIPRLPRNKYIHLLELKEKLKEKFELEKEDWL